VDSALEPVIAERLAKAAPQDQETALLSLKVCDPACGSGHFLVAAAHRLAKRLASIRSHEEEPAPSAIQHALRDVIGHCVYGVDLNPMAVELCKITLWMEAMEPGKPLTFLDHHIQCGNSLLGCDSKLLKQGIPDAAFTALTMDDRDVCTRFKRQNRDERQGVLEIFDGEHKAWDDSASIVAPRLALDGMEDDTLEALDHKQNLFAGIQASEQYQDRKLIFDAWCAAFAIQKSASSGLPYPITQRILDNLSENPRSIQPALKAEITRLASEYRYFHWELAFPEVMIPPGHYSQDSSEFQSRQTGFDCVLGNPPWERVKLQEKEFFAARDPEIANAANSAARTRLINTLPNSNPVLYQQFLDQKRRAEASSLLIREGGAFPLCGRGDLNTYTVFAELNRNLLGPRGRCGCGVPSGIATDDTTKFFFQDLTDSGSLISLYDFENREGIFPAVDSRMKFSLLTLSYPSGTAHQADFLFFAHSLADLKDPQRHFQLSASDIALINPNTRTCPIFRGKADAELTKYIYRRVPVLIDENDPEHGNPWGVRFSTMFHMSNDSHLFRTRQELEGQGFELEGNHFVKGEQRYLPLYEAKMIHHYDHRFGDYADLPEGSASTQLPEVPLERLRDPWYEPLPRYWVEETNLENTHANLMSYFLGFREVTNTTNERTVVSSIIPKSAVGHKFMLVFPTGSVTMLFVTFTTFVFDYSARQKMGGTSLSYFIMKQLPVFH
jgi:hypothetical protein